MFIYALYSLAVEPKVRSNVREVSCRFCSGAAVLKKTTASTDLDTASGQQAHLQSQFQRLA